MGLGLAMVAVGAGVCAWEQRPLGAQDSAPPTSPGGVGDARGGLLP